MKYGKLYGKDIESMTKEELKEHLIKALETINNLSGKCWDSKLNNL